MNKKYQKQVQWQQQGNTIRKDIGLMTLYQQQQKIQRSNHHTNRIYKKQILQKDMQSHRQPYSQTRAPLQKQDILGYQKLKRKDQKVQSISKDMQSKCRKPKMKLKALNKNVIIIPIKKPNYKQQGKKTLKIDLYHFGKLDKSAPPKCKHQQSKALQADISYQKQAVQGQQAQCELQKAQNYKMLLRRRLKRLSTIVSKNKATHQQKRSKDDKMQKYQFLKQYQSQLNLNKIAQQYLTVNQYIQNSKDKHHKLIINDLKHKYYKYNSSNSIKQPPQLLNQDQELQHQDEYGNVVQRLGRERGGKSYKREVYEVITNSQRYRSVQKYTNNYILQRRKLDNGNGIKNKVYSYRSNLLNISNKLAPIGAQFDAILHKNNPTEHHKQLQNILKEYFISKNQRSKTQRFSTII